MEAKERIEEFKAFYERNVDAQKSFIEKQIQERKEFLNEYPLERLRNISVDEYCLGTEHSKESLCYLLEFGKYKHTGFGIGGNSAKKFGVYYNKAEDCYKRGAEVIENADVFWPQFREEMFRFITDSGNSDHPIVWLNANFCVVIGAGLYGEVGMVA